MIQPIPMRMLQDTVSYLKYVPDTGEGSTYSDAVDLKNVKVEERKVLVTNTQGDEVVGNAIVFYDLINSVGLLVKPPPKSKIIFEDKTYHVIDTDILRGNSKTAHHYEILIK